MTLRTLPFALLFASTTASAAPVDRPVAANPPDDPLRATATAVQLGAGFGAVDGRRPFVGTSLALMPSLGSLFALELLGSSGYAPRVPAGDSDYWTRLSLGFRIDDRTRAFRPWGAFRLLHVHMAKRSTWTSHPLESLAGDSTHGLEHRSGAALAAGVAWTLTEANPPLRVNLGAELAWVPIGSGPRWFPGLELALAMPL